MKSCLVVDLGVIAYGRALELQRRLAEARKAGATPDVLLLCEHPHVITLGRNGRREHLRVSEQLLARMGVEFHSTDRGGDITYHGPGQQVGYPILHVGELRRDVGWYVRQLEEALIRAVADLGVAARREPGLTGVWVDPRGGGGPEKLAAIGVHFSRWVSTHGFACNVCTDLRYFDLIVPCGILGRGVTSLERLLGRSVELDEFRPRLIERFAEVYGFRMEAAAPGRIDQLLETAGVAPASLAAGT
ncbi:MAG TPA: lipoyl(octanoyl) transferase LipB [Candidatus Acidoferrales bacterium]|nr:lipoyl(octanoyl) transferase LipB [Candidatus Acidoferrales bacterium]